MKMENIEDESVNNTKVDATQPSTKVEQVAPQIVEKTIDDWEIDDLPSKFKLYPEGTKIFGRRLNVKEVKKLAQMNSGNTEEVIQEVLSSAIKGIDIEDLYDDDKLYIILWLRANTYREPDYTVSFLCDKCNSISDYNFQLENLKINYLEDYNLIFTLSNKDEITRKFLTSKRC